MILANPRMMVASTALLMVVALAGAPAQAQAPAQAKRSTGAHCSAPTTPNRKGELVICSRFESEARAVEWADTERAMLPNDGADAPSR